ncbi:MAG: peptidoglycan-binding protein, partial [Candidatus Sumerlaeia bacterium]|nr:peptidoglycan-binding protein [Candidatus Sumerlaeia bacterium]
TPEPTPEPTPTPEPEPEPTPEASALTGLLDAPTPTPAPDPVRRWEYDSAGIMRVDLPGLTYPAAVLTWVNETRNEKLLEGDLKVLREKSVEEVAALKLTSGRPPLYLREARLPAALHLMQPRLLPAIIQSDSNAPGFGPYSVLFSLNEEEAEVHDPRTGRQFVSIEVLEDHLTAIHVLFSDPFQVTGLQRQDRGPRVDALQDLLREIGVYLAVENSGTFDATTERAVRRFQEEAGLPVTPEIDTMTAFHLILEAAP